MNDALIAATDPRTVDAGRGVTWWTEAWGLFSKHIGMWLVMSLVMLAIFLVLNVIPILGSLAASLIAPAFVGSWMLAARKVDGGGTPDLNDLFTGFKDTLGPLLVVGALVLAISIVVGVIAGALGFGAVGAMVASGTRGSAGGMMAALGTGMLAGLFVLAMAFIAGVALWFAPALIVFRGMPPVDALKSSLSASLKNVGPFLVFGLLYLVAALLASIPFGLGWVVLVPLTLLAMYVSYRDVYGA